MNRPRDRPNLPSRDRGSAAIELTLITPLLIVVLMFVVAVGRLVQARLDVNDAAHQAARAASIARDPATATNQARSVAQSVLNGHTLTCRPLLVTTDTTAFRPGGQTVVTVSCSVALGDLSLLSMPGHKRISARFAAPIDTYRRAARR